ncbi:MAG: hypothetical protein P0121_14395 [Nitrospira sp.]|nr:hypothetical protein [Nitrospira sp.]
MSCQRCAGWLVSEIVLVAEGELQLARCANCGERFEAHADQ